jgi:DNA polymerase
MGRSVGLTRERGRILHVENGVPLLVTIHPSFLLRIRDRDERHDERRKFIDDLRQIGTALAERH